MAKKYRPQITPESPALCGHCSWEGTQATLKRHLATWDEDGDPVKPQCPGVRFYIDPDPMNWTTLDTYSVLFRKNVMAGMNTKKAQREASYAVGYKERPKPMTDKVRVELDERNKERKRARARRRNAK